jgi:MFS family permease
MYALGTFMPAFLSRVHGFSLARSGLATGCMYLVGGVCGGLLGGTLGDRVIRTRANGRLLTAAAIALLSAPLAFFGIMQPAAAAFPALAFLTVAYGAFNTYYGFVYSSIQDIVAPDQRGITMALYFMAMYLCGAAFGPLLTGSLSDQMAWQAMDAAGARIMTEAFKAAGLQRAMLIIPVMCVVLAAVLYGGSRTIGRDVARRTKESLTAG